MKKQALIIIDIQNIYFTEGYYLLSHPEVTSKKAQKILQNFRDRHLPVIHIKHLFDQGSYKEDINLLREFHVNVAPIQGELIVEKRCPNAFLRTGLKQILDENGIKELVVVGMMSHMCVDTTVRAAQDYGYAVTVVCDACTTKSLQFNDITLDADLVHSVFMASLEGAFASIETAEKFLYEVNEL
jgi:nicotinamidase-related amidase